MVIGILGCWGGLTIFAAASVCRYNHAHKHKGRTIMAGTVLRFLAWLASQIWRYGFSVIRAVGSWVKNNWRTVARWIAEGFGFPIIVEWVRRRLNI